MDMTEDGLVRAAVEASRQETLKSKQMVLAINELKAAGQRERDAWTALRAYQHKLVKPELVE